jgi:hypothetical protein
VGQLSRSGGRFPGMRPTGTCCSCCSCCSCCNDVSIWLCDIAVGAEVVRPYSRASTHGFTRTTLLSITVTWRPHSPRQHQQKKDEQRSQEAGSKPWGHVSSRSRTACLQPGHADMMGCVFRVNGRCWHCIHISLKLLYCS